MKKILIIIRQFYIAHRHYVDNIIVLSIFSFTLLFLNIRFLLYLNMLILNLK